METLQEKKIYNPYKSFSRRNKSKIKEEKPIKNESKSSKPTPKNLRPSSARRKSKQKNMRKQGGFISGLMSNKSSNRYSSGGNQGSHRGQQRPMSKEKKSSTTKNKFFTSLGSLAGSIFHRKESLDVERIANEKASNILSGARKDSTKPSGNKNWIKKLERNSSSSLIPDNKSLSNIMENVVINRKHKGRIMSKRPQSMQVDDIMQNFQDLNINIEEKSKFGFNKKLNSDVSKVLRL